MARMDSEADSNPTDAHGVDEHGTVCGAVREHRIVAQRLAAMGRITHGITHELNTPAQYISDSASFVESAFHDMQMLLESYRAVIAHLTPGEASMASRAMAGLRSAEKAANSQFLEREVPRAVARVLEGVQRMTSLIATLKAFAHTDGAGTCTASINQAVDVAKAAAHNECKYFAAVETQFGVLPEIVCRVGELTQAFFILIMSAAAAIERGAVRSEKSKILISTALVRNAVEVRFDVHGCAASASDFRELVAAACTGTAEGDGGGLDLAVARCIVVERHLGRIVVEYVGEESVSIAVSLPLATPDTRESS